MIGRPEKDEAAEFYATYIDKVEGEDAVAVMERQLEEVSELLGGISEEQSLCRYAPGKWSIREVVNHVTDTERIFAGRALWFARGLEGTLFGFDQDVAAARAEAERVKLTDHLDEFRQVRLSTISLFKNLPRNAWMRGGVASGNRVTVRAMTFLVAGHAAHHVNILRARYLSVVRH